MLWNIPAIYCFYFHTIISIIISCFFYFTLYFVIFLHITLECVLKLRSLSRVSRFKSGSYKLIKTYGSI